MSYVNYLSKRVEVVLIKTIGIVLHMFQRDNKSNNIGKKMPISNTRRNDNYDKTYVRMIRMMYIKKITDSYGVYHIIDKK